LQLKTPDADSLGSKKSALPRSIFSGVILLSFTLGTVEGNGLKNGAALSRNSSATDGTTNEIRASNATGSLVMFPLRLAHIDFITERGVADGGIDSGQIQALLLYPSISQGPRGATERLCGCRLKAGSWSE
jgi:hypothetical protein